MTIAIDMGRDLQGRAATLDLEELLATRLLVQGNSGSGKSHLLRRLLEQSAGLVQQIIIDPEGDFVSLADFCAGAPDALITGYFRAIGRVAAQLGLVEHGFRGLFNVGTDGGQEVPHLHIHLFGGKRLGPMLVRG